MTTQDDRQRNHVLMVLFVGVLMAALDIAIVGPALPALQHAFGVDQQTLTWVFTIYMLLNLVGTPLIAQLSDRFGRRSIYTLSVALFAAGSLLVAVAPQIGLLLLGRAIQGFGAGGIFPVASAVIGDTFPAERRGSALGMIGAVFGIAFLIGPILGGVLLLIGWQWLFLINLPIALLVIVLGWRLLPGPAQTHQQQFDWLGTVVLTIVLGLLAYGLTALGDGVATGMVAPWVWLILLVVAVLLPLFVAIERRVSAPVIDMRLFHNRQIVLVSLLALGAGLSEAITLFVPSLLVAAFVVTPAIASFMLIPMVIGMGVGSPFSGRMLDRSGSRLVVVSGAVLIAISLIIAGLFPANLPLYYAFAILFGVGIGVLLGAALRYIILNEVTAAERAAAQGLLSIFISIGQLVGAALIGALVMLRSGIAGYGLAFLVSGLLMVGLALAATRLKGRQAELASMQSASLGVQ
ncbi:MAG: MFS transporter [Roseiflexaceae bacterium]